MSASIRMPSIMVWRCGCEAQNLARWGKCVVCGMPRQDRAEAPDAATPASAPVRDPGAAAASRRADFGRCPHTGQPYRSRTEARWAVDHLNHRYEEIGIRTPAGVYWPDFVCGPNLYEVKGGWIRDRALHKAKAAVPIVKALGFDGIWLAVWDKGRWTVTELCPGLAAAGGRE